MKVFWLIGYHHMENNDINQTYEFIWCFNTEAEAKEYTENCFGAENFQRYHIIESEGNYHG